MHVPHTPLSICPRYPNPLPSQIHLFLKTNLSLVIINYMLMDVWANPLFSHIPKEK